MKKIALTALILTAALWAIVAALRMAPRSPAEAAPPVSADAPAEPALQKPNIHQVHRNLDYLKQANSPAAPAGSDSDFDTTPAPSPGGRSGPVLSQGPIQRP